MTAGSAASSCVAVAGGGGGGGGAEPVDAADGSETCAEEGVCDIDGWLIEIVSSFAMLSREKGPLLSQRSWYAARMQKKTHGQIPQVASPLAACIHGVGHWVGLLAAVGSLAACGGALGDGSDEEAARLADVEAQSASAIPSAPRELRAAWVATVYNIDWPSRSTLTVAQQQAEATRICEQAQALGLNALVLQVRPSADALYASSLEPWSAYLTGTSGKAPSPAYDPLSFWISEAHKRGLLLHAWFNPYRVALPGAAAGMAAGHISKRRPDLVRTVGSYLWMDPTEADTKSYTMDVISDVVRRYDIDGVHIDDYFYPYRSYYPAGGDFPDDVNWNKYKAGGGTMSRADWRRDHVNQLIQRLYQRIKAEKSSVLFGIAPFGIWRPGNPAGVVGLDAYSDLYADSRLWLNSGWLDYFAPQLYWPIAPAAQSYTALVDWWRGENLRGRHLWPGLGTNRVSDGSYPVREIEDEIRETRRRSGATGNIHYSFKVFPRNPAGLTTTLTSGLYAQRAVVPASPWLASTGPARPTVTGLREGTSWVLNIQAGSSGSAPFWYVVSMKKASGWSSDTVPAAAGAVRYSVTNTTGIMGLVVRAVDRLGNESSVTWSTPKP